MHILFWIWFENCFLPWHRRLPEESWNPRLRHCFYFLVCCNKSPQPSGSNHRNVLSNSSRGLWPGIKVSAGLCSLQVLLTSGGLLTIFGVSCLYAYLPKSLPSYPQSILPVHWWLCSISHFYKVSSHIGLVPTLMTSP